MIYAGKMVEPLSGSLPILGTGSRDSSRKGGVGREHRVAFGFARGFRIRSWRHKLARSDV